MKQCGTLQQIYNSYNSKVDFFWIYSQEARSSDTGLADSKDESPLKSVKNHRTLEERKIAAAQCAKEAASTIPQLLDDLNHSNSIRYHGHPTRLFVIDKNNKVSYAGKLGPFGTNIQKFENAVQEQFSNGSATK